MGLNMPLQRVERLMGVIAADAAGLELKSNTGLWGWYLPAACCLVSLEAAEGRWPFCASLSGPQAADRGCGPQAAP